MKQEDIPYLLAIIPCQFPKNRKSKFEIYSSAILSCRVLESGKVNLILVIRNKVIRAQPPRTLKMLMRENQNANTAAPKRLTRKVLLQKATVCSPAVHNSIVSAQEIGNNSKRNKNESNKLFSNFRARRCSTRKLEKSRVSVEESRRHERCRSSVDCR